MLLHELVTSNEGVLLDEEDLKNYMFKTACINNGGYISVGYKGKSTLLHRLILGFPASDIDHINRNKLDNRKENLRLCTETQNNANTGPQANNTSGYKGVYKHRDQWQAQIVHKGKKIHIGYYPSKELAAVAYNIYAKSLFKEFAHLNTIET